jgi:hypothetical protein
MSREPELIINCNLNSDHAQRDHSAPDKYIFETHSTLNLKNKEAYISVTDFQALHTLYNINSENNGFLGKFIEPGHYLSNEIVQNLNRIIIEVLSANTTVTAVFSPNTLKFYFTSRFVSFTLDGSILNLLNIEDGSESLLIEDVNAIISKKPCDILENFHNINIILTGSKSNNIAVDKDDSYVGSKISRIPINCMFGYYIVYHNAKDSKNRLYEKVINSFEIMILNDDNKVILRDTKFTMTLKIEVYNNSEPEEEEVIYKASLTAPPVITNTVVSFKDVRERYEEDMLNKKKRYLENHPLYKFEPEEILKINKKFKKIKKGILKKNVNR